MVTILLGRGEPLRFDANLDRFFLPKEIESQITLNHDLGYVLLHSLFAVKHFV